MCSRPCTYRAIGAQLKTAWHFKRCKLWTFYLSLHQLVLSPLLQKFESYNFVIKCGPCVIYQNAVEKWEWDFNQKQTSYQPTSKILNAQNLYDILCACIHQHQNGTHFCHSWLIDFSHTDDFGGILQDRQPCQLITKCSEAADHSAGILFNKLISWCLKTMAKIEFFF